MDTNHPFVQASRRQLRFQTAKGQFSTEDLWTLSLKDLDAIAVRVDETVKPGGRKTFLENPDRKADDAAIDNELRLEVLKFVIDVKQAENKAAKARADKRTQLDFLNSLLQKKQLEKLEGLSVEEIQAQMAALEN